MMKYPVRVAALASTAVLLAACGGGDSGSEGGSGNSATTGELRTFTYEDTVSDEILAPYKTANPDVDVCLSGPADGRQLREALQTVARGPLDPDERAWLEGFGDAVYRGGSVRSSPRRATQRARPASGGRWPILKYGWNWSKQIPSTCAIRRTREPRSSRRCSAWDRTSRKSSRPHCGRPPRILFRGFKVNFCFGLRGCANAKH